MTHLANGALRERERDARSGPPTEDHLLATVQVVDVAAPELHEQ